MRTILMVAVIAGLSFFAAAKATLAEGSRATVQDTINSQIEAFKIDDFAKAFTYASPTIKRLFGSADRFGLMVRQGYPMVWRPADVTFLDSDIIGTVTRQNVRVQDQNGQFHVLQYYMIETADGWLIDGVTKLPSPDVAA